MTHCATGFGFCCLFFTGVRLIPDHPECLLSAGLVNRTRIRPRAVGLNPSALRGEARLRGLVRSLRLCPSSPDPLLSHGEKGALGGPEAQNERRNAEACQKTCRWKRRCPGCARLRRAPGGMPATREGAPETRSSRDDDYSVAASVCPSSPLLPHGEKGEFGGPDG